MGLTKELVTYDLSLENYISQRCYGIVITATNNKTKDQVAIKLFDLSKPNFMLIEMDTMSRLKHPHIIGSTTIISKHNGALTDYIGVVMPLATCVLTNFDTESIGTKQCLSLFYKLANGLAYLHSQRILHLDIKSDNIVIKDGEPYWIDFGSSSFVDNIQDGIEHQTPLVSLLYRGPEIYNEDRQYTGATDVWAFGMLMLLTITDNMTWYNVDDTQFSYQWLSNKFNTSEYIHSEISKISKLSIADELSLVNVLASMLRIIPNKRITMEQICNHTVFNSVRTHINGSLAVITYSQTFHPHHHVLMCKLISWFTNNTESTTGVLFLTIDMYYRVANRYSSNSDQTLEILVILFTMACEILEDLIPDSSILDKLWFIASDKIQLKLQLLHELNGVIYHSPYYDAAKNGDELQAILTDIILNCDPKLYITTNIDDWFKELRSKLTITNKFPNGDVESDSDNSNNE